MLGIVDCQAGGPLRIGDSQADRAPLSTFASGAHERLRWHRRPVTMPFRLGELSLADVTMDAAVLTTAHSALTPQVADVYPTDVLHELGTKVAVIYSCPFKEVPSRLCFQSGVLRYIPTVFQRHQVSLCGSFADYLRLQFSSKSRSTLLRKVKKLARAHGDSLDVREYSRSHEIAQWHQSARDISKKTYQERLLKRGLPEGAQFVRDLEAQAGRGRFRGYLLFEQGEAIAFLGCPILDGGIMLYDHVGHAPDRSKLSPGTVLLYAVLEAAFSDPALATFDFTEGDGRHKVQFASHALLCADVWFLTPNAKNLTTVALHTSVGRASSAASQILDRAGMKQKLKRYLRATL